ncbi:MAG: hypothetical protein U1E17_04265 [Geminicoccaceae bacterium]
MVAEVGTPSRAPVQAGLDALAAHGVEQEVALLVGTHGADGARPEPQDGAAHGGAPPVPATVSDLVDEERAAEAGWRSPASPICPGRKSRSS